MDASSIVFHESQINEMFNKVVNYINNAMKTYNNPRKNDVELGDLELHIEMTQRIINDKKYKGNHQVLLQDLVNKFMTKQSECKAFVKNYGYTNPRFEQSINNFLNILLDASSDIGSHISKHDPPDEHYVEKKPYEKKQVMGMEQQSKQQLLHEAQILDSYRRMMVSLNDVIRKVESGHDKSGPNNLMLQAEVSSRIMYDKKHPGSYKDLIKGLENEFLSARHNLPPAIEFKLKTYLDYVAKSFRGPIDKTLPAVDSGVLMTQDAMNDALYALNYAGMINDDQKDRLSHVSRAEGLTIKKRAPPNPMKGPTYFPEYEMVDEHKKVFSKVRKY